MEDALIGAQLGQYRIVELIGRGGMASVYKAHQGALRRFVAIKVLPTYFANDPDFSERFRREALAVAQLEHPNILPIYDFGEERGTAYIVMPLVSGGTLRDRIGPPCSAEWSLGVCEQVARALDHAHARNVVHRDVKPANVLLAHEDWAMLADFGIARIIGASTALTRSGIGVGTPEYLSPEQGQGLPVDGRSDVYSLGVMFYEMVTGHVPYEAETPIAVVYKQVNDPVPTLRQLWPEAPASLEEVLQRGLAKRPEDRFGTAGEFVAALRAAVGPGAGALPQEASPVPVDGRNTSRSAPSRWKRPAVAIAVAAAFLVASVFALRTIGGLAQEPGSAAIAPIASAVPSQASSQESLADPGEPEALAAAQLTATPDPTATALPEPTSTAAPQPTTAPTGPPPAAPAAAEAPTRQPPARSADLPPRESLPLGPRLAVQITEADCFRAVGRVTVGPGPARDYTLKVTVFRPGQGVRPLGEDITVPGPEFRYPYGSRLPGGASEIRIVAGKQGLVPSAPATVSLNC